jgi:DNA-binding response OmpR family regulator
VPEPIKVVAILAASPALSSILTSVLAATPNLRVRSFESQLALTTYMRLSPVDLLVADFDCEASPAGELARALHADAAVVRRAFQIIALASTVDAETKEASIASGIDEVIVKPMSPKYLLERVLSRLRRPLPQPASPSGPDRRERLPPPRQVVLSRSHPHRGDNVIPLFKDHRLPVT